MSGLVLFALLSAVPAGAHIVPVYPVHATLKVDETRLRLNLRCDAAIWISDVLHGTPPGRRWPEELSERARAYVETHLLLRADGRALVPALRRARFVHEPWDMLLPIGREGAEGFVDLDLEYALPPDTGGLSGRALFYAEEWREHLRDPSRAKSVRWGQYFVTDLFVPGARKRRLSVRIEEPSFEIAVAESRRTPVQNALERTAAPAGWVGFMLAAMIIARKLKRSRNIAGGSRP